VAVSGAILIAAVFIAVLSAALSLSYLRRVVSLTSIDARALAASLERLPEEARLAEMQRRCPEGWERQLAIELVEAPGEPERVAIANDALADVAHRLDGGAGWPAAALRISALGALFVAAIAYLVQRTDLLLPVLGIGAAGLLASVEIGRRARSLASRQREALDALIAAAVVTTDSPRGSAGSWRSRRIHRRR